MSDPYDEPMTDAEPDEPTEEPAEPTEEPAEPTEEVASDDAESDDAEADDADDEAPPPPPPPPAPPAPTPVRRLPQGVVPLPVVPVGDPRIPADAITLAEATICATVFRRMADHAAAQVAAIRASDEEMPPFYVDDEDAALLASLFATDVALAGRIRLAAGSTPRPAIV